MARDRNLNDETTLILEIEWEGMVRVAGRMLRETVMFGDGLEAEGRNLDPTGILIVTNSATFHRNSLSKAMSLSVISF